MDGIQNRISDLADRIAASLDKSAARSVEDRVDSIEDKLDRLHRAFYDQMRQHTERLQRKRQRRY